MISTRQREALCALGRDEWVVASEVAKRAGMSSAYGPLTRLMRMGLVELDGSTWPHRWRRTGANVRFNDGGPPWETACSSFEPGDELTPLPDDICGACGRSHAEHASTLSAGAA